MNHRKHSRQPRKHHVCPFSVTLSSPKGKGANQSAGYLLQKVNLSPFRTGTVCRRTGLLDVV